MAFVLFVTGLFPLAGCSVYRIDSEDTTLDFYPPKASALDVAYLEKIDKPYEVVGVVSLDAERSRPIEDILLKMRYEAAILGGDAITGLRSDLSEAKEKKSQPLLLNARIRVRYSAKVIIFK
jgi:hypothetical protein